MSSATNKSTYCSRGGPKGLSWCLISSQGSCQTLIDYPSPTTHPKFFTNSSLPNKILLHPCDIAVAPVAVRLFSIGVVFTLKDLSKEAIWFLMQSPTQLSQQCLIEALKVVETQTSDCFRLCHVCPRNPFDLPIIFIGVPPKSSYCRLDTLTQGDWHTEVRHLVQPRERSGPSPISLP